MKRIRKILKVSGMIIGLLTASVLLFYLFIDYRIQKMSDRTFQFPGDTLVIAANHDLIEQGKHLTEIKGCTDCHGGDLGGKIFVNDKALGIVSASNLTGGKGGIGNYSVADWIKALRHGINREGKPLLIMPSHETTLLSKDDLGALIVYCRQLPPVDRTLPPNELGPVAKVMGFFGKLPLFPVDKINHAVAAMETAPQTKGIELGRYLSVSCIGCHRTNLKGGEPLAPGMLPAPDITGSGNPGHWSLKQFQTTLRTGKTPSGKALDNANMPWNMTSKYTDKEIESLYLYLRSL